MNVRETLPFPFPSSHLAFQELLVYIFLDEGEFLYLSRKLRKNSVLQVRIDPTSFRVLVGTLQPLSYWNLYGEQGRNLIITTPIIGDCIEPAYKTKTVQYILERGEFFYQKAQKKIPSSR